LVDIDCGYHHTIVLSEDGRCFVWGSNLRGQLGVGDNQNRNKPTLINNLIPQSTK